MNKRNTFLILILSLVTFLAVLFLLLFLFNIIKNKNLHINATLQTLENRINDKEKEKLLKQKILEVQDTSKELKGHYLDKEEIDVFVTNFENLGNKINTEITFKNVEVLKDNNLINFKILITGNFSQVIRFIELLENSPYQINIEQVFLNKSINLDNKNIESVNLNKDKPSMVIEVEPLQQEWQADVSFSVLSI